MSHDGDDERDDDDDDVAHVCMQESHEETEDETGDDETMPDEFTHPGALALLQQAEVQLGQVHGHLGQLTQAVEAGGLGLMNRMSELEALIQQRDQVFQAFRAAQVNLTPNIAGEGNKNWQDLLKWKVRVEQALETLYQELSKAPYAFARQETALCQVHRAVEVVAQANTQQTEAIRMAFAMAQCADDRAIQ